MPRFSALLESLSGADGAEIHLASDPDLEVQRLSIKPARASSVFWKRQCPQQSAEQHRGFSAAAAL